MYGLFADLVIAWYLTRLSQPRDQPAAKWLWLETLPAAAQQRLLALGNDHPDALFSKVSAWAWEKVIGRELYEQAIVTRTAGGYEAHDYVVDRTMRDCRRAAVPDLVWDYALRVSATTGDPVRQLGHTWQVGVAAPLSGAHVKALKAWDSLVGLPDIAPVLVAMALVNKGITLGALDRSADAIAVSDEMASRFGDAPEPTLRDQVAKAVFNKGITLEGLDVS